MHRIALPVLLFAILVLTAHDSCALSEPTIDRITFTGNLPAGEGDLLRGSGLHRGVSIFMVSAVQVRDAVAANLMSRGYLEPSVSVNWPRWGSETYEVEVFVDAGPRTLRGDIIVTGDNLLKADEMEELFPVDWGQPVSPSDTASFNVAVLGRYSARGYLRASISTSLGEFRADSSVVTRDVSVELSRGDICYLGSISVEGNDKVRDPVIRREFDLYPGEPMNMDRMRAGLTSLYSLGLFSGVQIDYQGLNEGRDTIDVVIRVTEQDYVEIDLAGGYISPEALFGSVFWRQPNIMGNNQILKLGATFTRYIAADNSGNEFEPQVTYEEPWFLSSRWRGQLKLDYYYLQRDHQEERSYGGEIGFSREFADVWRYSCGYRIERLRYSTTQEDSTLLVQDWVTSARISSGFTRDTRFPLLNPVEGSWFKIAGSIAGTVAGGSIDFYTVDGEYRLFFPVNRRLTLAGRAAGSVALGYSGNHSVPPNDRLYLGGGSTVRGYDFQTLGPQDEDGNPLGGNVMALGNLEARVTVWKALGIVVFADLGGVWTEVQQISSGTTGFGTGLGLRYDTPIGPVRLDYGFAPTWSNSIKRGKVYFAIGQAF